MAIIFKYKIIPGHPNVDAKSPGIPLTFFNGRTQFDTVALLDSGADYSCMPIPMAEILGLDLSMEAKKSKGIGGVVMVKDTSVGIIFGKGHEHYNFRIPIHVLVDEKQDFPALIGRGGFFDRFKITFIQKEEKIILKRNSKGNPNKRY